MSWHPFFLKDHGSCWSLTLPFLFFAGIIGFTFFSEFHPLSWAQELNISNKPAEFSARLVWKRGGKTSKAQLFVKGDRYRIEHQGGVRTELGYAGVTIVRLDEQKVWYILSRRRLVVRVPVTVDYLLPFSVQLEGETERTLIGDAFAGGRPAHLYEVVAINRHGRRETYYEWVDTEREVLLRLLSKDRDWSVEYEHMVFSSQPAYFFEAPLGYRKIDAQEAQAEAG